MRMERWEGKVRMWRAAVCFWLLMTLDVTVFAQGPLPQAKAWKILEDGAAEKSADRRSTAVRALGLLPNEPKAVELAEKALEDEKPEVREAAATALGQMGSKTSAPKLKKVLTDKETRVVLAAAHALLRMKDNLGYEVYYAILTGERKSGQGLLDQQVQMLKDPKKLEEFGFEEGIGFVPFAGMGYSAIKAITKDDVSPVRAAAAKVLSKDPDPASGQALVRAAADKSWVVRVAALNAIAERGEPSLESAIEPRLADDKYEVRLAAAAAALRLTAIGSKAGAKMA